MGSYLSIHWREGYVIRNRRKARSEARSNCSGNYPYLCSPRGQLSWGLTQETHVSKATRMAEQRLRVSSSFKVAKGQGITGETWCVHIVLCPQDGRHHPKWILWNTRKAFCLCVWMVSFMALSFWMWEERHETQHTLFWHQQQWFQLLLLNDLVITTTLSPLGDWNRAKHLQKHRVLPAYSRAVQIHKGPATPLKSQAARCPMPTGMSEGKEQRPRWRRAGEAGGKWRAFVSCTMETNGTPHSLTGISIQGLLGSLCPKQWFSTCGSWPRPHIRYLH